MSTNYILMVGQIKFNDKNRRTIWGIIVLALWTLVLLGLLLAPQVSLFLSHGFKYGDKIAHVGLFCITGFVSVFGTKFFRCFKSRILFSAIFSLVLAALSEYAQSLISSRSTDPYDLVSDLAGLFFGLLLYVLCYHLEWLRSRLQL